MNKGAPLFRLDDTKQKAALEVANKKIAEVDAAMVMRRPISQRPRVRSSRRRAICSKRSMS